MNKKYKHIFIVIFVLTLCSMLALLAACQEGKTSESDESVESFESNESVESSETSETTKSVYQQYIERYPDYSGTEEEWLEDLLGGAAVDISTGKSVYELYKEVYPDYKGSEEQWLKDLLGGKLIPDDPEPKMFTVSFFYDENDEEPWAQVTVEDGDTAISPGTPEKRGYNFIAWGYQGYEWPFTYPIRQDTVLTAMWEIAEYDIKYNLNGGVNSQYNRTTYTIEQSFDLQTPTKDYYDFKGWYTTSDFDENSKLSEVNSGDKAEDLELWAKWTPTAYNISYAGIEGSTIDAPTSYNVESDDITLPQPERDHYTFDGWTGNGTTTPEKTLTIASGSHGDLEYTAKWTAIVYKITYDLGGGTNPDDAICEYTIESFENSDELLLPAPSKIGGEQLKNYTLRSDNNFDIEYTVANFTFGGWFEADDVERTHRYESVQLTDGDLNLVAYWIVSEGNVQTKTSPYCRNGNELLIGSYPQSDVTDEDTLAGLAEFEFDTKLLPGYIWKDNVKLVDNWTDSGEKYWYRDVEYNGKKYRGLSIIERRDGSYRQDQAGYFPLYPEGTMDKENKFKFYWFNYDPIKWSVVYEGNGEAFLVCKTKLETMKFGDNRWAQSPIRDYLNDTIYNIIFNDEQKAIVLQSTVANDIKSMGGYGIGHEDFATQATNDYLFLLSYEELNLYKSKFIGSIGTSSYCVATLSRGDTWTRSHCKFQQNSDKRILAFNGAGEILSQNPEYDTWGHILPAMRISL